MSQHDSSFSATGQPGLQLPPLEELLQRMHTVAIPTTTTFRGVNVREAVLFVGPNGASEFSPFLEYDDAEASVWLAAAIEFGWGELPVPLRQRVSVNATVPAVSADEVAGVLAQFHGCTTAKVKVAEPGQTLADDVARVRAVRGIMGADAKIRVDANGGWSVAEALTALRALAEFDLDYAEQPCASVAELAELRGALQGEADAAADLQAAAADLGISFGARDLRFAAGSAAAKAPVRIAADESVRKATDPLEVARAGAADLIVVKAQPLGGVRAGMRIASEAGLPVVVSSALDTSIGIAMGAHLAASLPEGVLAGACGLGTAALLAGDVTDEPLLPVGGFIEVRRPALCRELLAQFAAEPARDLWWRERVTRCYARLAA